MMRVTVALDTGGWFCCTGLQRAPRVFLQEIAGNVKTRGAKPRAGLLGGQTVRPVPPSLERGQGVAG